MVRTMIQLFLAALLLPVAALGADLSLSLDGNVLYDSNVFRRENNIEDDVMFQLIPSIKLHEDRGQDVNYSLEYIVPVRWAVEFGDELNDVDQIVNGDIRYHVNDRMDIYASDQFRYLRSTLLLNEFDADTGAPSLNTNDDRVTINIAELGTSYRFAPRLTGSLTAQHQYFNTTRPDRQENWSAAGVGDLQYTLTSKHIIGLGVRYMYQEFEPTFALAGSTTNTANGFLSWRYQISETLAFSMSAGPAYIASEFNPQTSTTLPTVPTFSGSEGDFGFDFFSCPVIPGTATPYIPSQGCGGFVPLSQIDLDAIGILGPITVTNLNPASTDDDQLTVFGDVVLSKRWTPNHATALRYERTQGNASGLGGTVTVDAASLASTWDFAERWQFAFRADWTRRESVADVAQVFNIANGFIATNGEVVAAFSPSAVTLTFSNSRIETNRWGVSGRITHRLFRRTSLYAQAAYNDQTSESGTLGGFSDFQDFLGSVGVRHTFEPVTLW